MFQGLTHLFLVNHVILFTSEMLQYQILVLLHPSVATVYKRSIPMGLTFYSCSTKL